jgi:hypothetical protein
MQHPKTTFAQQRRGAAEPPAPSFALLFGWIEGWLAWLAICRAYYRAALTYEELYRLPDGELKPRGYTRATLARDVTGFDVTQPPNC